MIEVIHESRPKARKEYPCNARDFLNETLFDIISELTYQEKRSIVRARRNKWKIKKGETYVRQFNKDGDETWTFRAIPEIDAICHKFDLYDQW